MTPRAVAVGITGIAAVLATYAVVAYKRMFAGDPPTKEELREQAEKLAKAKEQENECRSENTKEREGHNGLEANKSQRQVLQPQAQRSSKDKQAGNYQIVSSPG